MSDLAKTIERISDTRVLVVGDIMLDVYKIGAASRISPEAPVPVLLNPITEYRLGGAAAVAAMCAALGANVTLCGIVGNDRSGKIVSDLLAFAGVERLLDWTDSRRTTTKKRTCGVASGRHRQQLVRTDTEDTGPLTAELEASLIVSIQDALRSVPDIILVSDYAKGCCSIEIVAALNSVKSRVIVDPPRDFLRGSGQYAGSSCIVPNRQEANGSSAAQIVRRFSTQAAIVKLDEEGCEVAVDNQPETITAPFRIGSRARAVHDVTGAGDQFLAVLGCARAAGADWISATELANSAAGLQVERQGCDPVTIAQFLKELSSCHASASPLASSMVASTLYTPGTSTCFRPLAASAID